MKLVNLLIAKHPCFNYWKIFVKEIIKLFYHFTKCSIQITYYVIDHLNIMFQLLNT